MFACDNDSLTLTEAGAFYRKFVKRAAKDFQWPGYEADELYRLNC